MALVSEGEVTVMAAAGPGGPGPDLYQLLGVSRDASREDIAPGRFRARPGPWHVLGHPARRAAYDQALARQQTPPPASRVPERPAAAPAARLAGSPPLWAGPVRGEGP